MLFANLSLMVAGFSLALAVGGGFYEGLVVNPQWSANPPSSFALIQKGTGVPPQKFWILAHIIITVALIAALILNWQMPTRRVFIVASLVSYIIMRVWSFAYFIPEMLSFQKMTLDSPATEDLLSRVANWKSLTYWRTPLDLISFFAVLWPLTINE